MARSLNFDDRHVAALSYEAARARSASRSARLGSIVAALDAMSADTDRAGIASADVASADVASADLMTRQACYRSAAAALATPVAPSLLAFLS